MVALRSFLNHRIGTGFPFSSRNTKCGPSASTARVARGSCFSSYKHSKGIFCVTPRTARGMPLVSDRLNTIFSSCKHSAAPILPFSYLRRSSSPSSSMPRLARGFPLKSSSTKLVARSSLPTPEASEWDLYAYNTAADTRHSPAPKISQRKRLFDRASSHSNLSRRSSVVIFASCFFVFHNSQYDRIVPAIWFCFSNANTQNNIAYSRPNLLRFLIFFMAELPLLIKLPILLIYAPRSECQYFYIII